MTRNEWMQVALEKRPDLIKQAGVALAQIELIDPSFLPPVLEEMNRAFELLEENKEKLASVGSTLGHTGLAVGGTVASGIILALASDLYDASKRGLTSTRNFHRILESNPDLKEQFPQEKLRKAFDSIHRFGPEFTADPLVGGAILRQVAMVPEVSQKAIVEMLGARKNLASAKNDYFKPNHNLGMIFGEDIENSKALEQMKKEGPVRALNAAMMPRREGG